MRDRLPLTSLPSATPFTQRYIEDFGSVGDWFDYSPFDQDAWQARLDELAASSVRNEFVHTAELAAQQQERWGGDTAGIEAAGSLGQPHTHMVVTGQQPGLFGGPLYSQLKAITTILLARHLTERFPDSSFVPVFWIASADSDFDEVCTTTVLSDKLDPVPVRLRSPRHEHQMLAMRSFTWQQWHAALTEVEAALPGGPLRDETLAELRGAYCGQDAEASGGMAAGFARWMVRLFRGTGLVIIEPQELLDRADIGALFGAHLRRNAEAEAALQARSTEISSKGFTPQVSLLEQDSQLFRVDEQGQRDKLLRDAGGGFHARRSGQRWSVEELSSEAEAHPLRFTPSALMRPVVESMLFPTAAWVGGQAELAYRAQSQALFKLHGLKHPPAFLRHHGALLPRREWNALSSSCYEYSSFDPDQRSWAKTVAAQQMPSALHQALRAYQLAAEQADDALLLAVEQHLPELQRSLRTMRGKLQWHLARVERKVLAASLRGQHAAVQPLLDAHAVLFPGGRPQERTLNLLSFLPRAGFGLIPKLLDELSAPCWEFCLMMVPE